ncbi:MAG: thiosulfate sulfurtransferase GlpE [Kangiellaceae bacterium]|jgi:thiosulfate sulfurtransferase|nr:thiosulfate sulfurtransferase GlpE [Kangiellaceae bacterium]
MFNRISIVEAKELLDRGDSKIVDIRDPGSYASGHVAGAINLNNDNFAEFINDTAKDHSILVMCYHGNSSQQVAGILVEQGFTNVSSVDGGCEGWKLQYEVVTD